MLHWRTQGLDGLFHEFLAPGVFLGLGLFGRSKGMMKTPTLHDAIGADTGSHGIETGGEDCRNPHPFTLFGDRSTATRTRASRGWQNHSLDPTLHEGGSNLSTNAFHGVQTAHIAHGDEQVVQHLTDHPGALQRT